MIVFTSPPIDLLSNKNFSTSTKTEKELSKDRRRMTLLRRMGLFSNSEDKEFEVKRAFSKTELECAYKIVHDIFVEQGYIRPLPSGMRLRPFELSKHLATFIACSKDGNVGGVLSLMQDTKALGLPSDTAFYSEINLLRKEKGTISEVTNQVVLKNNRSTSMTTELMQAIIAQAIHKKNTAIIIAISPSESTFYQELLHFEIISEVKSYSTEINDPVVLMKLDIEKIPLIDSTSKEGQLFAKKYLIDNNPYTSKVAAWESEAHFLHDYSFFQNWNFFTKSKNVA